MVEVVVSSVEMMVSLAAVVVSLVYMILLIPCPLVQEFSTSGHEDGQWVSGC